MSRRSAAVTGIGHPDGSWLESLGLSDFVAVDVETSGLDPASDQIIEIGAVRFRYGRAAGEFQRLIHADRPLDPKIVELTGITEADLADAPMFEDAAPELFDFLADSPLVGHNLEFDLSFLRSSGRGLPAGGQQSMFAFAYTPAVDTSLLARVFWPDLPSFSLLALSDRFRVPVARAHRALDDARVTAEVLVAMVRELPERVWSELARDLHRLVQPTKHRSRFFFAALVKCAAGLSKPPLVSAAEAKAEESNALAERSLHELLGVGGVFDERLSFFRSRPMQLELARRVENAFEGDEILLAEAPTGVGKSLAYLVPALRWSLRNADEPRQVIVSSYTKVLQEQLCRKDMGEIRRAAGGPFRAAVLKGRNNYLCKRRLRLLLREARERLSDLECVQLMPLLRWSETTSTGDVSEITAFNPRHHPHVWAQVSSDSLACAGSLCSASKGDFHRAALERAAGAHVLFVNHALLLSDFARFQGGTRRYVLDEAHQLERAVVAAMTIEVSAAILRNTLSRLMEEQGRRGLLPPVVHHYVEAASVDESAASLRLLDDVRSLHTLVRRTFDAMAGKLAGFLGDEERMTRIRFRFGDHLHGEIALCLDPLLTAWTSFTADLRAFVARLADLRGEDRLPPERLHELRSACDNTEDGGNRIAAILRGDDRHVVTWAEAGRSARAAWCSLYAAPVSVSRNMEKSFWPQVESAVLTSATLTSGGSFGVVRESLGLEGLPRERVSELVVGSPFRLESQMRIYVPTYLPDPRQSESAHAAAVAELVSRICARLPRGTLVLCTSNELVSRLTSVLTPLARRMGRCLLSQSASGSVAELVAEFRRRGNAILVGAASLWEGIDVVGEALQLLVVTRLPFDVPTDPWIAARCEALQESGQEPFRSYSLPVATLRLKQGIGRLIRHPSDRGIAVIGDPRLFSSRYGATIRDSLAVPARAVPSEDVLLDEIVEFLEGTEA